MKTLPKLSDITILQPADVQTSLYLDLYGTNVSAGFPSPSTDYLEGKLDLNEHIIKNPPATFFVRVSGDSMTGAGIYPDDLLVVDKSEEPKHGKIVIAVINGELTVKRLNKTVGGIQLLPENPSYLPIHITPEMDFSIWGVVTYVIHKP
jgi:DNA polymerase V